MSNDSPNDCTNHTVLGDKAMTDPTSLIVEETPYHPFWCDDCLVQEAQLPSTEATLPQLPKEADSESKDTLIQKLEQLRAHLYGLDSGSGEAELLHEAITELKRCCTRG